MSVARSGTNVTDTFVLVAALVDVLSAACIVGAFSNTSGTDAKIVNFSLLLTSV